MRIDAILQRDLTNEQYQAATDRNSKILTLACAGSGKSRTLAYRIARLIAEGEPPSSIVAFTFTEKAAESIKQRVAQALTAVGVAPTVLGAMYIGTIHAFCQLILTEINAKYRQYDVLDDNRLILYLMSRYPALGLQQLNIVKRAKYFETVKEVSNAWKIMNDEFVNLNQVAARDPELGNVLGNLSQNLNTDQFLDFSTMVRWVVEHLRQQSQDAIRAVSYVTHLMVDEYQDVNPSQEQLIQLLHQQAVSNYPTKATLFVVGDDDQAIYSWRGADVSNILEFEARNPGCSRHTLSTNFRSTQPIVDTAERFAAAELNPIRITKKPQSNNPPGPDPRDFRVLWFHDRNEEAAWVSNTIQKLLGTEYVEANGQRRGLTPADFAILMRSTRGSEQDDTYRHSAFTQHLSQRDIPYSLKAGGGIFDRPQVTSLQASFALLRGGTPTRLTAKSDFDRFVLPAFPSADFTLFSRVLNEWGNRIHRPAGGSRQRLYPQQLVYDLLNAFQIHRTQLSHEIMQEIGVFSRIMQDVEAVYLSVDSTERFVSILNFLDNIAKDGYDVSTDEILDRPDAVMVSTVHQVKGLEFPVVFLVDVEAERFPGRRHNYRGWLPAQCIQTAIARGAYQSNNNEEARLFYTALTRAERFLYVTGSENLPGGRSKRKRSNFALRLIHPEINDDPARLPTGLKPYARIRRQEDTTVPTTFSDIRYYLRCPKEYQYRRRFGFSPAVPALFGFGTTVHTAIGRLHQVHFVGVPSTSDAEDVARSTFHLKHVYPSNNPSVVGPFENARESAVRIVQEYVREYGSDFERERQVEVRFEIPARQAVITGSIDLLLKQDALGKIVDARVIDFKTMEGGIDAPDNNTLDWRELALQVQLYAKAARDVLGEDARTGAVHLLKDNQRIDVPVSDVAVAAAVNNVEWAVDRILENEYPMRPSHAKCSACDFRKLCAQTPQQFSSQSLPSEIHIPGDVSTALARVVEDFDANHVRSE